MRQSVMSGSDGETLWSWLQTAGGAADLAAWQRLLGARPLFASLLLDFPDVGEIARDSAPLRDIGL